jgi:hypothetical protein
MLRPRKKYTVFDLRQLKGKRCLTHIHVKSPEEAAAAGTGCDTQFLFSDDILGDYDERPPRHAKTYRNFFAEHERLQRERVAAFGEYIADVRKGRFPERCHLIEMEEGQLRAVIKKIAQPASSQS